MKPTAKNYNNLLKEIRQAEIEKNSDSKPIQII